MLLSLGLALVAATDHFWVVLVLQNGLGYVTRFQLLKRYSCRHFVTLSIYLCLQHDGRDIAHHTGPSAAADTC